MYYKELEDWIDCHKEALIQDVIEIVKIPSVSRDTDEVKRALKHILSRAREMGFEAKSVLDDQIGIIEYGEGEETIGILTHIDVVPPGNIDKWRFDPFDPLVQDGALFGRGTLDDKGPAIASLYAMKGLLDLGYPFKKKIQMIIGTKEEVEWTDMDQYVREFPLPDYGFTPDGEFPLCNIEKGFADIDIAFNLSNTELKSLKAGESENTVPDLSELQLGNTHLKYEGKAVHACQPALGENAIVKMFQDLTDKFGPEDDFSKVITFVNHHLIQTDCSGIGLKTAQNYVNDEFVDENTLAITVAYYEDNRIVMHVNLRFTVGTDMDKVRMTFEDLSNAHNFEIVSFEARPVVYIEKNKPFLKVFEAAYENVTKTKNAFSLAYGGSYAKAIPNIISWGPVFPGTIDYCHEVDERIEVEALITITKIYAEALSQLVFSKESYK